MSESTFNIFDSRLSRKANWESLILVSLLFFLTNPYFFWQWYGDLFVTILVSTIAMLIIWKHSKLTGKQATVYVFYVFVWVLYLLNEFSKGARLGVVAYFPYVLMGFVPCVNKDFGKKVFGNFATIFAILIGVSMIFWGAAMLGLIEPIGQLGDENESLEAQSKSYLLYPMALVSISNIEEFTRFCGIFDEPGVVGTLSGLILCALRYNMRDWRCIIVLLSGLLSTSMFFYALTAIYWVSELILVKKKFGAFVLIVVGIFTFYLATNNNEAISFLVWDRFEWNSKEGGFEGNSRENEGTTIAMQRIRSSGEIWLGVKDKAAFWDDNHGSSSIYTAFALYGIVFVLLYISWLLLVGAKYKENKWDYLLYCFVVIGCMYQRPNLYNLPYTFLFVCIARYYDFYSLKEIKHTRKIDFEKIEALPSN